MSNLLARPPRLLVDVVLVAAALSGTLGLLAHGGLPVRVPDAPGLDALGVGLALCASLPLFAWRRFPLAVFATTAIADALIAALGYRPGLALGSALALYLLAASRDDERPWTRATTLWVLGLFGVWIAANLVSQSRFPATDFFHGGLALATGWFAGERTRLRRRHVAELEERAVRVEREAERDRRLALAEERARIARDVHDSAGHTINVIAVLAGAARLRGDAERSSRALETIEGLARDTVGELDQILHTLREPGTDVATPPGLASLGTLVAHHASAGLAVTLQAGSARRPLAGAVDQAAFRILQEALTNAARHGTGTAHVEVAFSDAMIELTVTNPVRRGAAQRATGGHGLLGMRERASLTGGRFETEQLDGTFRVHAALPYAGSRG